jgi:predicted Zn-dependent peptidase
MKKLKKHILILAAFLVSVLTIYAQQESSVENIKEFDVNGIKVILKSSPKEVVSVSLYVKGGTANYSKEQEGIDNFALNLALSGGTTSMDKIAFSSAMNKIGARIGANSDYDYSQISLTCVKQFWDESWNLYADAIMNPAFEEGQYSILKEQLIAAAKQQSTDPDTQLRNSAMANVFKGKNYAKIAEGTEESLTKISLEHLKEYYKNLLGKNRIFVVVAGDVSQEDISKKITATFGLLPDGTLPVLEEPTIINEPTNVIIDKDIETNYIRGYMTAPKMDSKEGVAMIIAMQILSDRLFVEIRTKRGLSYAPAAFYARGIVANPYNVIYVSSIDPKQSIKVMVDEIDKLRSEGYSPKELMDVKQSFLTQHYMGLETMALQAGNLGLAELKGNWKMAEEFANIVNDITLLDINQAMVNYSNAISWTYLGKKDMISEEDFLQPKKLDKIPVKH